MSSVPELSALEFIPRTFKCFIKFVLLPESAAMSSFAYIASHAIGIESDKVEPHF